MHVYPQHPSQSFAQQLRRRLLAWFDLAQRSLPWRKERDPYRTWVSEIMLQQTQVATVIPFYERFLQAFPGVRALAAAREQQVLRLWEGLGYYRRARDLRRAAQQIMRSHGGQVPSDPSVLESLPGIGRYTAGAILSQAFDQRVPILEANSRRVLSRLFACTEDPRQGRAERWLWQVAEKLLPPRRAGQFNQALMELGALICTPQQPDCTSCPVAGLCAAHARGWQHRIPVRQANSRITMVREAAVVLCRGSRVLLVQRPATGRWANMWEFPHGPLQRRESAQVGAERLVGELIGLEVRLGRRFHTVRHGITRFLITMTCYLATQPRGRFRSAFYPKHAWVRAESLPRYALSVPQRRVAEALVRELDEPRTPVIIHA